MGNKKLVYTVWAIIAIMLIVWLASCYTPQKAVQQSQRAISKHPAAVLPIFRGAFPCITTHTDTFLTTVDTIINIDCPDTSAVQYFTLHDTITGIKYIDRVKSVPVKVQLPGRIITKYIEDSSKLKEAAIRESNLTAENKKLSGRVDTISTWLLWLLLALAGMTVFAFRKAITRTMFGV